MVGTWPRRMDMIGPYFRARAWRPRWGSAVSMWRFPMIGSGQGPGGSFRPSRRWIRVARWRRKDKTDPSKTRRMAKNVVGDILKLLVSLSLEEEIFTMDSKCMLVIYSEQNK